MSRVLLTWELGLNLGHLTRLLPIAQRLKEQGCAVLIAARDIQSAARVLGPAGIDFIQAPHLPNGIALGHRATGYADILLSQGWSDPSALWGLTQGWRNLFRMFRPDHLILDYSPTVSLASHIDNLPCVIVGNGFELPPLTDPLPPFPGFSWATAERATKSERIAVDNANAVLRVFGARPVSALRDLFIDHVRRVASFPELDHYGERADVQYIGPLLGQLNLPKVDWPAGEGPRIFACLQPDTSHVQSILGALSAMRARVVCVASGFTRAQLAAQAYGSIRVAAGPVDLTPLLDADLCITYGAEGTILRFLLAGVPQLVSPWHVEAFMAARRIEMLRVGHILRGEQTAQSVLDQVSALCANDEIRMRVKQLASHHRNYQPRTMSDAAATATANRNLLSERNSNESACLTEYGKSVDRIIQALTAVRPHRPPGNMACQA